MKCKFFRVNLAWYSEEEVLNVLQYWVLFYGKGVLESFWCWGYCALGVFKTFSTDGIWKSGGIDDKHVADSLICIVWKLCNRMCFWIERKRIKKTVCRVRLILELALWSCNNIDYHQYMHLILVIYFTVLTCTAVIVFMTPIWFWPSASGQCSFAFRLLARA